MLETFVMRYASKEKLLKNMKEMEKDGWCSGKIIREVGVIEKGIESFRCEFTRGDYNLFGIWNNPYVCELGILEHCNEVNSLQSELCIQKALKSEPRAVDKLKRTLRHEEIDLMLILLNKGFTNEEVEERVKRFKEKARESEGDK